MFSSRVGFTRLQYAHVEPYHRQRGSQTNGLRLDNGGNIFSGCHIEGGERFVIFGVGANYNFITDSSFYAPDGLVAVLLGGSYCRITGMVGGNKDLLYPNYTGVFLGIDAAKKVFGNVIAPFLVAHFYLTLLRPSMPSDGRRALSVEPQQVVPVGPGATDWRLCV